MILLKHFKKVSSDKSSTQLVHKDGHKVSIAHNALSPKMKKQISEMPHMNSGGDVTPGLHENYLDTDTKRQRVQDSYNGHPTDITETKEQADTRRKVAPAGGGIPSGPLTMPTGMADGGEVEDDSSDVNMSVPEQPQEQQPMMSQMSQEQMSTPPQLPNQQSIIPQPGPQQQMVNQMEANQQAGNKAMSDYAASQGQQGAAESKAYQENQQKLTDLQNMQQQNLQNQDKEMDAWISDAKNGHIDPNHYVNNMTGGQKIIAIGLLLGGVSAGLTGKDNPVQKILEDNINRDVEAQKANMSQKNNVFRAMQQKYGNQKDAALATQLFYRNLMVDKVMQAAAQNKGPQAQMQAQMFAVQQQQQMMPIKMQLATSQTINQALDKGTISPEQAIPFKIPDKTEQSKAFDSLGKIRAIDELRTQSMKHFDDIADKMRTGNVSPNLISSEKQLLAGKLVQLSEGRYNYEAAQNMVDSAYPKWNDFGSTINQKRDNFKGLFDVLRVEHEGRLKGYNIPVPTPLTPKSSLGSGFTKRQ